MDLDDSVVHAVAASALHWRTASITVANPRLGPRYRRALPDDVPVVATGTSW
jgi:hypothetical protein